MRKEALVLIFLCIKKTERSPVMNLLNDLEVVCQEVRRRAFQMIFDAGSGHLGGSSSSLELMVSLYFGGLMCYDHSSPRHPYRDRVLVRGHLGPLRYSIFSLLGWVKEEELSTYRRFGSRLQGHEAMELLQGVDITPSGMLGMVLSYGVGSAISLANNKIPAKTWVFLGDGEEQEGNISEAARHAAHMNLSNLACIIDRNQKQLSQPTSSVDSASDLAKIWSGYGWLVKEIKNGHSVSEIIETVSENQRKQSGPILYIANTVKGFGLKNSEAHPSGYHTFRTCPKEYVKEAMLVKEDVSVNNNKNINTVITRLNKRSANLFSQRVEKLKLKKKLTPSLRVLLKAEKTLVFEDGLVSYFKQLVDLFKNVSNSKLYVVTGDVTTRDLAEQCGFLEPHVNYIDVGIREQHLFAMTHGISTTSPEDRIIIIEGEAFLFRAADQIQSIAQAGSKIIIIATDSGICESLNGSTHQSTGQSGAFINMPGMFFLEPADTVDLRNCLQWALTVRPGPVYIRLHSAEIEPLEVNAMERNIEAYRVYQSQNGLLNMTIVSSGFLVGEAIKAARKLEKEEINVRVINAINLQKLSSSFCDLIVDKAPLLTVYNGNPFVLQSAVANAIMENDSSRPSIIKGYGFSLGTSGKLQQLTKHYSLDADGLVSAAKDIFQNQKC